MSLPETAREFLARHVERVRQLRPAKRLVFPEGSDPRIVAAAERLAREGLAQPIRLPRRASTQPSITGVARRAA